MEESFKRSRPLSRIPKVDDDAVSIAVIIVIILTKLSTRRRDPSPGGSPEESWRNLLGSGIPKLGNGAGSAE